MSYFLITIVLVAALVAAFVPVEARWVVGGGLALAFMYWLVGGLSDGYEGLDGGWFTAFFLIVVFGFGAWCVGVGIGRLVRRLIFRPDAD